MLISQRGLAILAILNAILYSAVLPLWEGFDEPFHFGYVQNLANARGLPDPRTTYLSREIYESLRIAPASESVKKNLPFVRTYQQFDSLPEKERHDLRKQLNNIDPRDRWEPSGSLNYEAHHPPLAYVLLAIPERALWFLSLPARILVLRFLCGAIGSLLLLAGMLCLFKELAIPEPYRAAAYFCVLSCQMTWASLAHVANDWLAIPLIVWTLSGLVSYWRQPSTRHAVELTAFLTAGLLTKAYFLPLVPSAILLPLLRHRSKHLFIVCSILLLVAGPWYGRNLNRYGEVTGTLEARSGVTTDRVIKASVAIDWLSVLVKNARWALWTGNNTFRSFSTATLDAIATAIALALLAWAVKRPHAPGEWVAAVHLFILILALGYATVAAVLNTSGTAEGPSAWYTQMIIPPIMGLAFLGLSRAGTLGKAIATALLILFCYVLSATYVAKLIPLYGGYPDRASFALLLHLYGDQRAALVRVLDDVCLGPGTLILCMTAVTSVYSISQFIAMVQAVRRSKPALAP